MNSNDSNTAGENILNAVKVLRATYKNLKKLKNELNVQAKERDLEILTTGNYFLFWFSSHSSERWVLGHFIKVFRQKTDEKVLFTVELNIEDFEYEQPSVVVGCHFYDQIPRLDGVNGGSRRFNERYWNSEFLELSIEGEFITSRLKKEKENSAMAKHGFNRAIFKKSPLFELTKNNLEEKIFNVFDELKRKGGMPLTPN